MSSCLRDTDPSLPTAQRAGRHARSGANSPTRARRWLVPAVSLVALVVLVTACSSGGGDPQGTWGSSTTGQPQLVLDVNGQLSGTDGCNRLNGTWSETDGKVTFGKVSSMMMHCDDVDTWLSTLASATVNGDTLHVLDDSGAEIGTLPRLQVT